MKKIIIMLLLAPVLSFAQINYSPGNPNLNPEVLKPFEAVYNQMGMELKVSGLISNNVYHLVMVMPNFQKPNELITDVIGHNMDDFSFAYRHFTSFQFGLESVEVKFDNEQFLVSRTRLDSSIVTNVQISAENAFDATAMFWFMAAMPLGKVKNFTMSRWKLQQQDISVGKSAAFTVVGNENLIIDGVEYHCMVVEVNINDKVTLRNYVSHSAPFLVKQEVVQGNEVNSILELTRVRGTEQLKFR